MGSNTEKDADDSAEATERKHERDSDIAEPSISRDKWENQAQFMLSCIGYSVGLGNVWRFPYLCYKHGGAAFLLVYLFLQLTIGKPLYFMELVAGQYSGKSVVRVWDLNPAARGLGFSMCLVSLNISLYYNVIMAYVLFYFFGSFIPDLPWNTCKEEWENCFTERISLVIPPKCEDPAKNDDQTGNCTCSGDDKIDMIFPNCTPVVKHSTDFFFNQEVLNVADDITSFGVPSYKLTLLLILSWIIVTLCLIKGIKSSGKVVYFTATFPYLVLLLMLIRGALLDGAEDGVKLFIIPDWAALSRTQLWTDAAGQMFFSLSLSMGGIIMYGSYNKFTHPIYRDALIISSTDLLTSTLAGFVIFSTLGYMAKQTGKDILTVAESSFGLAFVAYPETLSTLALPNLWSCLFFFMLYTLGLDSQFALLETVLSYLLDDWMWCRRNSVALRIGMGVVLFLLGLPLVCPGGVYLITVLDQYGSSLVLIVISMLETMSIMWGYGIGRFLSDIEYMLGKRPRLLPYWYFVWLIWSPIFLLTLFVITAAKNEVPRYNNDEPFGPGMQTLSWLMLIYTILPVPLWFFLHVAAVRRDKGPFATYKELALEILEPTERWGPNDSTEEAKVYVSRRQTVWADVCPCSALQEASSPGAAHASSPGAPSMVPASLAQGGPNDSSGTSYSSSQPSGSSYQSESGASDRAYPAEREPRHDTTPRGSTAVDVLK